MKAKDLLKILNDLSEEEKELEIYYEDIEGQSEEFDFDIKVEEYNKEKYIWLSLEKEK